MNIKQYVSESARTAPHCKLSLRKEQEEILHSIFGMQTELGEFTDIFKREFFYQKKPDLANIKEELGDIMWYWALAVRTLELDPEEILKINIEKLKVRFPEKFTEKEALHRNLAKERTVLEQLEMPLGDDIHE